MFWLGAFHVTGLLVLVFGYQDPYGLTGSVQPVAPSWELMVLILTTPVVLRLITAAGIFGILAGLFHLCVRPPQRLYNAYVWEILKQFFKYCCCIYSSVYRCWNNVVWLCNDTD
jgi:hypothetical protein